MMEECNLPPKGWACTRAPGHDGPCAAVEETDLVYRLRKRAKIRAQISTRKSVQEGKPDRIGELLLEAADALEAKASADPEDVKRWVWKLLELHGVRTITFDGQKRAVGRQPRWALISDLMDAIVIAASGKPLPKLK